MQGTVSKAKATACTTCAAGFADTDKNASTACATCGKGTFSEAGATVCQRCGVGRASSTTKAIGCTACSGAKYAGLGATVCTACYAGKRPNTQRSSCEECKYPTYFSVSQGACIKCDAGKQRNASSATTPCELCAPGKAGVGGQCSSCSSGEAPNPSNTACTSCSDGKASANGKACVDCGSHTVVNAEKTGCDRCSSDEYWKAESGHARAQCVPCNAPLEVSNDNDTPRCVCGVGMYNASVTTARCIDDQFRGAPAVTATAEGCQTCPPCIDCEQARQDRVGAEIIVTKNYMLAAAFPLQPPPAINIFRCGPDDACKGNMTLQSSGSAMDCELGFAGTLCSSCSAGFYPKTNDHTFLCEQCDQSTSRAQLGSR